MNLYQKASNAKINVSKTVTIKIGNPDFAPPDGMAALPSEEPFRHLGIMFTSKEVACSTMEQMLLSDLVDRIGKWKYKKMDVSSKAQALNIFIYSKLWYVAHIVPFSPAFEKKVLKLTRTFLWGSASAAPIAMELVTRHCKEGGLGLLPFATNARKLWGKGVIRCIEANCRSPAMARAINWAMELKCKGDITTESIRNYMYSKPKLGGARDMPYYWKEYMRNLRKAGWQVSNPNYNKPDPLRNKLFQAIQWSECTSNKEKADLRSRIANAEKPVYLNGKLVSTTNYQKLTKRKIDPQFPRLVQDWNLEGDTTELKPKEIAKALNCKLVPISQRSVTWRVLQRAYKSGTHSGENYPYKECIICNTPIAGVDHRYFYCQLSSGFWKAARKELGTTRRFSPGKDIFFSKTMMGSPPLLRVLYYHHALNSIHRARKSWVIAGTTTTVPLMILGWKSMIQQSLERISRFGSLIPGRVQDRRMTIAKSEYVGYDMILKRIIPVWSAHDP